MRAVIEQWLLAAWQRDSAWLIVLRPLSAVYGWLAARRRKQQSATAAAALPVVVVGNITVGGSGKTPLLIAIAEQLAELGWHPGIVSRGYGGQSADYPLLVTAAIGAEQCGDEPRLIADRTALPVMVDPDRRRAVAALVEQCGVNLVLSDDGLQHYRMARTVEIVVVDGERQFSNQRLLPAGSLREPLARLESVDLVVINGGQHCPKVANASAMQLAPGPLRALNRAAQATQLQAPAAVHAVAAIGNPQRFASTLQKLGFDVQLHGAADHAPLSAAELCFDDGQPVVVTEKDAVKLSPELRDGVSNPLWVLPVNALLADTFWQQLTVLLGAAPVPETRSNP